MGGTIHIITLSNKKVKQQEIAGIASYESYTKQLLKLQSGGVPKAFKIKQLHVADSYFPQLPDFLVF